MKRFFGSLVVFVLAITLLTGGSCDGKKDSTTTVSPTVASKIPKRSVAKQIYVQSAYNSTDNIIFFKISFPSTKSGRNHMFYIFEKGQWKMEGADFRNDGNEEGEEHLSHESRAHIAWADPYTARFSNLNISDVTGTFTITRIDLFGVMAGQNTDSGSNVYLRITGGPPYTVSLYKSSSDRSGGSNVQASGSGGASTTFALTEQNNSGLSGRISLGAVGVIGDKNIAILGLNKPQYFEKYGCMLLCHDNGGNMPQWTASGEADPESVDMRLPTTGPEDYSRNIVDIWQYRAHRGGPVGYCDDQYFNTGGRKSDTGTVAYKGNGMTGGNPDFVFDKTKTGGKFTFKEDEFESSTMNFFYFTDDAALIAAGHFATKAYATAQGAGYTPQEGDVVPSTILQSPTGSRSNVTATIGTQKSGYNFNTKRYEVYLQRALTPNDDANITPDEDIVILASNPNRTFTYNITFAVHSDDSHSRDHYIRLPFTFGLNNSSAQINSVEITGASATPDFSNTMAYPIKIVDLFLPGITSWEFVNAAQTPPLFGQMHGGRSEVQGRTQGCADCHVVREDDPGANNALGGPLQLRVTRRGGVSDATPISFDGTVKAALLSRCAGSTCHGSGAPVTRQFVDVSNSVAVQLIRDKYIDYTVPQNSKMLTQPLTAPHPTGAGAAVFADKDDADYRRILRWILYNGPNN